MGQSTVAALFSLIAISADHRTQEDGTAYSPDDVDHTCNNWTSNNEGSAQVGHHDRHGGGNTSWNAAHATTGCSQEALQSTGGAGLFYCFAAD
jgi:hypothetical protein